MKTKRGFFNAEPITLPEFNFKIKNPLILKEGEDFDISFFEGVLRSNPYLVECLKYLGNAYTSTGMHEKGLDIDVRLSRLLPDDSEVIYNLACSYSLLNQTEPAIEALKRTIDLGYNDINHLEHDRDIDNIRNDLRYKTLINDLKMKTHLSTISLR